MAGKLGLFLMCLLLVGCAGEQEVEPIVTKVGPGQYHIDKLAPGESVEIPLDLEIPFDSDTTWRPIPSLLSLEAIAEAIRDSALPKPYPPRPKPKAKVRYDHTFTKCNGGQLRLPEGSLYGAIIEERGDGWWIQLRGGGIFCLKENPLPFLD